MASIEEKVEEFYKKELDYLGIRHFAKTEPINTAVDEALFKSTRCKVCSMTSEGSSHTRPHFARWWDFPSQPHMQFSFHENDDPHIVIISSIRGAVKVVQD